MGGSKSRSLSVTVSPHSQASPNSWRELSLHRISEKRMTSHRRLMTRVLMNKLTWQDGSLNYSPSWSRRKSFMKTRMDLTLNSLVRLSRKCLKCLITRLSTSLNRSNQQVSYLQNIRSHSLLSSSLKDSTIQSKLATFFHRVWINQLSSLKQSKTKIYTKIHTSCEKVKSPCNDQ